MDLSRLLPAGSGNSISCVDMHTTGEPTRVIVKGYPRLTGTLLEQRAQAKSEFDHVRRRLMLEPRGHYDMYGAILRPETELTKSGEAHIGVLFTTNDGYSTMCGHATIALGRLLLDTHDLDFFPRRNDIKHDAETRTATLNLHAPCGLLKVSVPVNAEGSASDPTRPVSFVSVPSFATGTDVILSIPEANQWPEIKGGSGKLRVDFAYGGAFYCFVSAQNLGFPGGLHGRDLDRLSVATASLKSYLIADSGYKSYFEHPEHQDLSFLYGVIVTDDSNEEENGGSEVGLCFFANQEIDRSPTGSGVAARAALAIQKGERKIGEEWVYHSLVSREKKGPGFTGTVVEEVQTPRSYPASASHQYRVRVEGKAFYTGVSTFLVEEEDPLGDDGFIFREL
ncbi:hypothetical protein PV10_04323 [Exophiala mesophila]|uniref:trans-L-3-hydroxyproline dehydratase n=1 Tax=Exophiala mesophila TaxID=212818 RepID=A0A0D1ZH24_EXOME|nr:uncharacterized protein PV10_04323 [Exophiala mesophila]KIV93079.1 hypothetical protein PV10_04323 [Exophiala mesophila]